MPVNTNDIICVVSNYFLHASEGSIAVCLIALIILPHGYVRNKEDHEIWHIDEQAAKVVRKK